MNTTTVCCKMNNYYLSILAGIVIGIGCLAYSKHTNYMGAFLFSLGLCTVIELKLWLYTGKIHKLKLNFKILGVFICNFIGISIISFISKCMNITYQAISEIKLNKSLTEMFFCAIICGILMTIAVEIKKPLFSIMCVMSFILIGSEHCIANVFYLSNELFTFNLKAWSLLFVNLIGNTIGSKLFYYLLKGAKQ